MPRYGYLFIAVAFFVTTGAFATTSSTPSVANSITVTMRLDTSKNPVLAMFRPVIGPPRDFSSC